MVGKVVGLGFEITSQLDSYFLMTVYAKLAIKNVFIKQFKKRIFKSLHQAFEFFTLSKLSNKLCELFTE